MANQSVARAVSRNDARSVIGVESRVLIQGSLMSAMSNTGHQRNERRTPALRVGPTAERPFKG